MENKLKALFEYQKFEGNPRLQRIIEETEKKYSNVLSDDQLELVSAAGTLADREKDKKSTRDE